MCRPLFLPVLVLAVLAFGGCSSERPGRDTRRDTVETAAAPARPRPIAPQDTPGGGVSDTSVPGQAVPAAIKAQIDTLLLIDERDLRGSLRRHQQAVRAMIASFDADMRALHVDDHPEWTARLENLESQVRLMEDMSVDELHAFLPEYRASVAALVRLHAKLRRGARSGGNARQPLDLVATGEIARPEDLSGDRLDLLGDVFLQWVGSGQIGCLFAMRLARTPDQARWTSVTPAVDDGLAQRLQPIIEAASKGWLKRIATAPPSWCSSHRFTKRCGQSLASSCGIT